MRGSPAYDAVIVGAGPNGLAAAITLARQDYKVLVLEAKDTVGGGMRSKEVTLPGFCHDICSAIHPLGLASPFMRSLPLEKYGLEWIQPPVAVAHPLDGGRAVLVEKSLEATAARLGQDGPAYRRLMAPLADHWDALAPDLLGPLPLPPRHPLLMAGFGLKAIRSASGLAGSLFKGEQARAVFAGMCGHSMLPLEQAITADFGLMVGGLAHVVGWPLPRYGSQSIANALAAYLGDLGGEIRTASPVKSLGDLPPGRVILFDPHANCSRSLASACRGATAANWKVSATARGCSRLTMPWMDPSPGGQPALTGLARCTWAAPWRKLPLPSAPCGAVRSPSAPSCFWPSKACSTPAAPRLGSTPPGLIAMCRTALRWI